MDLKTLNAFSVLVIDIIIISLNNVLSAISSALPAAALLTTIVFPAITL
jgi:hypothetical protein